MAGSSLCWFENFATVRGLGLKNLKVAIRNRGRTIGGVQEALFAIHAPMDGFIGCGAGCAID